jgi:two-component system cell cycle sensor histidine kinase/response regulator CckA
MERETTSKPLPTVLMVDDQETILRALHNYLEKNGYNFLEAQDGEEALLIAECYPAIIDVLVTDLVLAQMNGHGLMRRFVPLRPEMQVIMTSDLPEEIVAQQGLVRSVPILRKPVRPKPLLRTIKDVLANPKSQRSLVGVVQSLPPTNFPPMAQSSGSWTS